MLEQGELLDVGVLWGANTNDSFMDISQDHTKDNGDLEHMGPAEYTELVHQRCATLRREGVCSAGANELALGGLGALGSGSPSFARRRGEDGVWKFGSR